jgi:hypothetical protein
MSPDATGPRVQQRPGHGEDVLVAESLAGGKPQELNLTEN